MADLLLSFTAAFEHIPLHRRLGLFGQLAKTLGPEDSLFAIIALLVDRYPSVAGVQRFVSDLLAMFDPMVAAQVIFGHKPPFSCKILIIYRPQRDTSSLLIIFCSRNALFRMCFSVSTRKTLGRLKTHFSISCHH